MSEFLTYSKFYTKEEAEEFAALLDANNIIFDAERQKAILDTVYVGEDSEPNYIVKVRQEDFSKVNELMKREAEKHMENVTSDYYLFQFTNEELADVIRKPEEWNYLDQLLAQKILKERNVTLESIPADAILNTEDLVHPSRIEFIWLFLSFIGAIVFPYVGFVVGLVLVFSKRTLKDGSKMNMFDNFTRNYGWILLGMGILRTLQFSFLPLFR